MKVLTGDDFKLLPWKNGGGLTRELYLLPHPTDASTFVLRLSIATVTKPGPFSLFPHIDRTLLILDGEGVSLELSDARVVLTKDSPPFAFPGESPIHCELLGGEVRDFNLMVNRTVARADLEVRSFPNHEELTPDDGQLFIYVLEGSIRIGADRVGRDSLIILSELDRRNLEASALTRAIFVRPNLFATPV